MTGYEFYFHPVAGQTRAEKIAELERNIAAMDEAAERVRASREGASPEQAAECDRTLSSIDRDIAIQRGLIAMARETEGAE